MNIYSPPTMFGPIILMLLSMFGLNPGLNGKDDRIVVDFRVSVFVKTRSEVKRGGKSNKKSHFRGFRSYGGVYTVRLVGDCGQPVTVDRKNGVKEIFSHGILCLWWFVMVVMWTRSVGEQRFTGRFRQIKKKKKKNDYGNIIVLTYIVVDKHFSIIYVSKTRAQTIYAL